MMALTVPAHLEDDATVRPVPWRRMAWVTWRQHRLALAGVTVFLGAVTAGILIGGTALRHAHSAAVAACHFANSPGCQGAVIDFNGTNGFLSNGFILQALPVLIGAFVGAPVLARELETGTFRYAWTQGFGRWRWALAKLVLLAAAVTITGGLFSLLLSWYYQPYFAAGNQDQGLEQFTPFSPGIFDLRGISFAAWTLTAFSVGALAGMLIRRVVPAIVATLAVYTGLAFAAGGLLRQHYWPPLVTTNLNIPGTAWILSQWWTKDGKFAFAGWPSNRLFQQFCPKGPPGSVGPFGKPKAEALAQCLTPHGYTQWTSYQPASRLWLFQWIESGWLLALSALLIAATIWLVRRRAT
jgi:hypothetical protein